MILYTLRDLKTRREAITCGILAGLLGAAPALPLLLAMGCGLPEALRAEAPVTAIFQRLDMPWLYVLFEIVLFGTLVETAAGFIKALEDRIEQALFRSRSFELARPLITGAVTALVDRGYGAICYAALALYALPMLTIGIRKLRRAG